MPTFRRPRESTSFSSLASSRERSIFTSVEEVPYKILRLSDITDATLRSRVGQLLAIAPELPVQDLVALLIANKGSFEKARESVYRQTPWSSTLSTPPEPVQRMMTEVEEAFGYPSAPKDDIGMTQESDGDEDGLLMKLETNHPEIWYDNDVSPSPLPLKPNANKTGSAKKSKKTAAEPVSAKTYTLPLSSTKALGTKPFKAVMSKKKSSKAKPCKSKTSKVQSGHHACLPGHSQQQVAHLSQRESVTTRTYKYRPYKEPACSPHLPSPKSSKARARGSNSIDNVFFIPDPDIRLYEDELYEDSHQGTDSEDDEDDSEDSSDVGMGDLGDDLYINMKRPFGSSSDVSDFGEI